MRWALALASLVAVAAAVADGGAAEKVPLYTGDDLDRMFGPPPPAVRDRVDKSTPDDWRWVESFLDRQYARIDADRSYDLSRHLVEETYVPVAGYASYPVAWGLHYPASTWWGGVHRAYVSHPPPVWRPVSPIHGFGGRPDGMGHGPMRGDRNHR